MKKSLTLATALILCASSSAFAADMDKAKMMADKHMMMMDTDGDGMVSKDEFMSGMEKKFSDMDMNSDGMLSKDEMMNGKMKEMDKMKMKKSM